MIAFEYFQYDLIFNILDLFFVKKKVMVKAGIPQSISEETVGRVLQKTDEMDSFSEEKNPDQIWPGTET